MMERRATIVPSGRVLLARVRVALGAWERFRGLMLRRALAPDEGLLIPSCRSIHTCFMRFPIDVVYLAEDGTVVKVVKEMRPWRLSCCLRAAMVLEMPAGTARRSDLSPGQKISVADAGLNS